MFRDSFEKQAEEFLPNWIGLASQREIKRPIETVVNLLPDALEQNIYSNKFMFGSTPISEAFQLASLRMLDPSVKNHKKVLLVISDGEFKTNIPLWVASMLREVGVVIVCCYIFNHDLPEAIMQKTGQGAQENGGRRTVKRSMPHTVSEKAAQ